MLHVAELKLIQDFSQEIVIGNLIAIKNYSKSLFQQVVTTNAFMSQQTKSAFTCFSTLTVNVGISFT